MAKTDATASPPETTTPVVKTKGIMSRLNHPVTLTYGADTLVVPPRGRIEKINPAMLGALPAGVIMYDTNAGSV